MMKQLKYRLILMNFLQFFIWGAWLISLGGYMASVLHYSGLEIGAIYGTMGIASLFMPGLLGILADKYVAAQKLLGACHLIGAILLVYASTLSSYSVFYPVMLLLCMSYMPTLALTNTIAYTAMEKAGMDIVREFPPIRVWGTVGFILAMWTVDICGWVMSSMQFYVSAVASLALGLYAFTLPHCPPAKENKKKGVLAVLGLDAFVLFRQRRMAIFFLFAMLLGAALQVTNTFGNPFLSHFADTYSESFAVQHPNVLLSLSQISETLFILTIPFFMGRFGIKRVMLMSMLAWVLRFAFFGLGNPGSGFISLVLSMIVYGMAFDFFNISGSMFVDRETTPSIRAAAQGLFMIMTNGIGAIIGGFASGWVVDRFTDAGHTAWSTVWYIFAAYALVIAILFAFFFKSESSPLSRS
ncbi:nucleoside permease [Porphyromonas gingivalis]|uniref:nucleoside permease n=1 Tax=Porphyromonas gingivalis TaxID=837 RepID=UPI001F339A69|nr:nucleoside permease [Porphyromonas gingivalis]MCE8183560.1 nucleoside permease [Porphyromonas gingivalis]